MSIINLIEIAEADIVLADDIVWMALSDTQKTTHIFSASLYMQNRWYCVDVDWEDPETLDIDLKLACSFYAQADMLGLLFPALSEQTLYGGKIIEESAGVGSLKETIKWSKSGSSYKNPLTKINDIMRVHCVQLSSQLRRN